MKFTIEEIELIKQAVTLALYESKEQDEQIGFIKILDRIDDETNLD